MKKTAIALVLLSLSASSFASHWVNGYSRSSGTYVEGHMSQNPGEARSSGYSYHNNELERNGY